MISESKESISQTSKAFMVGYFKRTFKNPNRYYIHIDFSSSKKQMLGILVLILYLLKKLSSDFLSSLNLGTHFQLNRNDLETSVSYEASNIQASEVCDVLKMWFLFLWNFWKFYTPDYLSSLKASFLIFHILRLFCSVWGHN